MTTYTPTASRAVLADLVFRRSLATDAVLVVGGVALTTVLAQVAIPMYPVPITGQTLAVLLVGSSLGALRGGLSMVLYALGGLLGLPIYAPQDDGSHLTGMAALAAPSFGYILGFIVSAVLVGWLAQRQWDRKILKAALTFVVGTVVTFAVGLPWLAAVLALDLQQTLAGGLYPFLIGGAVKAAIATGLMPAAWVLARKVTERRRDDR